MRQTSSRYTRRESTHYLLRVLESHNVSSPAYNSLLNAISIGQFSLSIGRNSKKIMVKALSAISYYGAHLHS